MSRNSITASAVRATAVASIVLLANTAAICQPLGYSSSSGTQGSIFQQVLRDPGNAEVGQVSELPAHLRRQVVAYQTREAPGTIIIDTPRTQLLYVLSGGRAISYGIGVGRDGFTWSGVQSIARKAEWPDWTPPEEMLQRQPYLPRFMAGGPGNPLGARAMYLGGTIYRIHGTNAPETIGTHVSSGCIRMLNEDVIDLYNRVSVGTKVVVLPDRAYPRTFASAQPAVSARTTIRDGSQVRAFGLY
jgi:lipoprotein-anchoring transpeptidase ErfK/SrfK